MSGQGQPDLCIVGGSVGGLSLALQAAASGLSVVLVENGAIGGDRLTDVIPCHALLAASRVAVASRSTVQFGIATQDPHVDFAKVRDHITAVVAAAAPNYTQARLEAMNVRVIRAPGRFTRPDAFEVDGEIIKARRFVIATGTFVKTLPIPGLDMVRPFTGRSLCALDKLPQSLVVIGADPDGLALAQGMRRLGCDVIVLTEKKIFASEDEELVAPVREGFARDGLVIHEGVRISRVEPHGTGVRVFVVAAGHERPIAGSHLLIAFGRAPLVEGLGLTTAQVRYDENGVQTRADLRTSNPRIYAIGDVRHGTASAGAAEYHANLVLCSILGLPGGGIRRHATARVTLTAPPLAVTGLSEAQARAIYRHIRVLRWPFAETDRARIEHRAGGHIKLVTSRRGTILGAGIAGAEAEELINLCTLAISKGMTAHDIASTMIVYPALSEGLRSASMTFAAEGLDRPQRNPLLRLLRWLQ